MADCDTLMAFLVPKYTDRLEDAATDALAHILNKSDGAMQALRDLLGKGGFGIEPIDRVQTQVSYDDGCRPDMAGYDKDGKTRLLVESKFWATFQDGQVWWYARHLDRPGPAAVLVICPEVRRQTVWADVKRQFEERCEEERCELEDIDSPQGVNRARVVWKEPSETELHVLLVSWGLLLKRMDNQSVDADVRCDIRQLRGLAHRQDKEAFMPLNSEDLGADQGRRMVWYYQLVDDTLFSRGEPEGWMDIEGRLPRGGRSGFGCAFRFACVGAEFRLEVNYPLWARCGITPLWLGLGSGHWNTVNMDEVGRQLGTQLVDDGWSRWVPIRLKTGVEYDDVLDDVAAQLKRIGEIVCGCPAEDSPPS